MIIQSEQKLEVVQGNPRELGVTKQGTGVNFAVFLPEVQEVVLVLFAKDGTELARITLGREECTHSVFSCRLRKLPEDAVSYCYEAKGVSFPDPYGKRMLGCETYGVLHERQTLRAAIWEQTTAKQANERPDIPLHDLILYKLHVRGFTMTAPVKHKGTYLGVAEMIPYLKELGVNGVLLMPVQEHREVIAERRADALPSFACSSFYHSNPLASMTEKPQEDTARPKVNYWGYAEHYFYFAPKASFAAKPEKADWECQEMIRRLHEAGIQVFLEWHMAAESSPKLLFDALRHWVRVYGVDGFRLDGSKLPLSLLASDPELSDVRFFASEVDEESRSLWNSGKRLASYRDEFSVNVRRFLKGDEGMAGAFARLMQQRSSSPAAIHYVADHNGFTLYDLYCYNEKHNLENGENGRDGTDANYSWNCGQEGETKKKKIRELRSQMRKNAFMALLLSQGVPMLLAGDEFGNSQQGNNNAYCQDNETGWVDWKARRSNAGQLEFVRQLISFRKAHRVLHNPNGLRGTDFWQTGCPDVSVHSTKIWYPDESWNNRSVGILYSGSFAPDRQGEPAESVYLLYNMYWEEKAFEIPRIPGYEPFRIAMSSAEPVQETIVGQTLVVPPRSSVVLVCKKAEENTISVRRKKK